MIVEQLERFTKRRFIEMEEKIKHLEENLKYLVENIYEIYKEAEYKSYKDSEDWVSKINKELENNSKTE